MTLSLPKNGDNGRILLWTFNSLPDFKEDSSSGKYCCYTFCIITVVASLISSVIGNSLNRFTSGLLQLKENLRHSYMMWCNLGHEENLLNILLLSTLPNAAICVFLSSREISSVSEVDGLFPCIISESFWVTNFVL